MQKKHVLTALFFVALVLAAYGHNPDSGHLPLRKWHLSHHRHLHASFLMMRHDSVVLELESGATRALPLASLSAADRDFVRAQEEKIERLNQRALAVQPPAVTPQPPARPAASGGWAWVVAALLGSAMLVVFLTKKRGRWAFASVLTGSAILLAFRPVLLGTDPHFVDAAFKPFKPHVATHWDGTWFYVESKGIPTTHSMMRGITKWQQQVPIPQCYIGANAWQIPLNPELADQPVPVNPQHFIRGAIAIAANGVPIFNPYTNTGVDALVDGQLDEWGGHSGRADDYHYHIAPLHLDTQTTEVLPIAFGLDGFAVYGPLEPDGSAMLPLDSHHGHFDAAGVYHYHGTPQAPYMIGDMVGKVTEDATMQI
ncbi:MAG TPA: YHYH protein, partial [Saprospiraceae bacterium]|nr:YHYH protein [Saprospiraceae bacterium]